MILRITSTYRGACLDHPLWLQLCRAQFPDATLVQSDSRSGYAPMGVRFLVYWTVPIPDL